ncbi:MAG TPA: tail fiber protein [Candidatus Saccharimonadales bacterium]|nr:tail fiber protein [Candidatus Saccharimonadales bacterium]
MAQPYLGEIKVISWNFPPKGWAFCNGQFLPINQNQALFSILGTTYGGNGQTTFALPNLQGRSPVHVGDGISLGEMAGEASHTLNVSELPAHTHAAVGSSVLGSLPSAANNVWGSSSANPYNFTANAAMSPAGILAVGGNQPHDNMSPYLVLNFIIALQGIFPSRN